MLPHATRQGGEEKRKTKRENKERNCVHFERDDVGLVIPPENLGLM
jgi:hypothetical protein